MATKQVIAELLVEIGVDAKDAEKEAARIEKRLKKVGKSGEEAGEGVDKAEKSLKRFAAAGNAANKVANGIGLALAGAATAIAGIGKAVLGTGAKFETLKVQLKTATGSAEGARKAFEFIKEFAAKTPFQVGELTEAFVKLKNFGIEPTERTLTAFGDFASAFGKTLDQLVNAVADATTNEFERLKEFGIKTDARGEMIKFTFKGVTTEIEKDSAAIQGFLLGLAEQNFGGAMEDQAKTTQGVISNLMDTWTFFLNAVANLGPLEEFKLLIEDLKEAAGGRTGLAKQLAGVLVKAIRAVRMLFLGDLIPTLERVLKVIEFVINNFELLAAAFVAGKLISGVAGLATAFSGLGLSIAALTGPVGIALAAIAALGVAAVVVARKINAIPKILPPPGPVIDEKQRKLSPVTAPKIEAAQDELQALRLEKARHPAFFSVAQKAREKTLEKRLQQLNKEASEEESTRRRTSEEAHFKELFGASDERLRQERAIREVTSTILSFDPTDEFGRPSDEASRGIAAATEAIEAGGDVQAGLAAIGAAEAERAEAEGFGITGKRVGADTARKRAGAAAKRKAKEAERARKKEEKAKRFRPATTVSEFFAQAQRGELGAIAARTPAVKDIEPTVAVDLTNNNFDIKADFKISGVIDPQKAAGEAVRQFKVMFDKKTFAAGNALPANRVR